MGVIVKYRDSLQRFSQSTYRVTQTFIWSKTLCLYNIFRIAVLIDMVLVIYGELKSAYNLHIGDN